MSMIQLKKRGRPPKVQKNNQNEEKLVSVEEPRQIPVKLEDLEVILPPKHGKSRVTPTKVTTISEESTDITPAPRKRGRPTKQKPVQEPNVVETLESVPTKVGRPPKSSVVPLEIKSREPPKKRGRPPKVVEAKPTQVDQTPTVQVKKRGRPPKPKKVAPEIAITQNMESTEPQAKKRGRPPKISKETLKETPIISEAPKKRGRPPKVSTTESAKKKKIEMITHYGSCHCGAVHIQVVAPKILQVQQCNCTICTKKGYLHLIVSADRFKLIKGQRDLTCYTFNTKTAQHYFCKHCGIAPYYIPRSNPDGFDVNVHCLDKSTVEDVQIEYIDGQNWETSIGDSLKHLSKQ